MKLPKFFSTWFAVTVLFAIPTRAADPLDFWEPITIAGVGDLNSVAYGSGMFVAVGVNGRMLTSNDGAAWTNTSPVATGTLNTVRFLNGQFTVVGNTGFMYRSSDGTNWTSTAVPGGKNFWDVAYGNGRHLLAGDATYISTNALNWTATNPTEIVSGQAKNVTFESVTFGDGEFIGMGIAPGLFAPQGQYHTVDGSAWRFTSGPVGSSATPHSQICILNAKYAIAHNNGLVYSSTSGSNWVTSSGLATGIGVHRTGIAFGAGQFVAVGTENTGPIHFAFHSSTNLQNWMFRFTVTNQSYAPSSVAFGNGRFIVVGVSSSGALAYRSGDLGGAPEIIAEPQDRAAVVGNPVSFNVVVAGSEPLRFFWQKNEITIPDATNSAFTISNLVVADTGGYRVIITNSFGSVTSRVAQLSASFLDIHQYAGITILGMVGKTYRIEAAPTAGGGWIILTNIVLPRSPYVWIDFESPAVESRVYRAAELP